MFIETLLSDPIYFLRVVAIVILSVTLHELGHGWAAIQQGDDTPEQLGHMTLNPVVHMGVPSLIFLCLAGIAWGAMPVNPSKFRMPKWGNILVAAAGPLMNLAIALGMILVMRLTLIATLDQVISLDFFFMGAQLNIVLFLFNLLPFPPLDGFSIASEFFPALKPLHNSPFGIFCLMLLFWIPAVGRGLWAIANFLVTAVLHI